MNTMAAALQTLEIEHRTHAAEADEGAATLIVIEDDIQPGMAQSCHCGERNRGAPPGHHLVLLSVGEWMTNCREDGS